MVCVVRDNEEAEMEDKAKKCNHRDSRVVRAYYDAQGKHRVKHAFDPCADAPVAVDVHGLGYCAAHRGDGDFGYVEVDLDAVLADLIKAARR
jgi:hypothetical protein